MMGQEPCCSVQLVLACADVTAFLVAANATAKWRRVSALQPPRDVVATGLDMSVYTGGWRICIERQVRVKVEVLD